MQFMCDRLGFPLVRLPEALVDIHLLPLTKVQLERYLAEPDTYGDRWYEDVLAVNPRISYRTFADADRERLLATGLLPEEGEAIARWLGAEYRLPMVEEWRAAYQAFRYNCSWEAPLRATLERYGSEPARQLCRMLDHVMNPVSLLEMSLLEDGVVEWARMGQEWVGLGSPRAASYDNLFDPLSTEVRPIRTTDRLPFFGVRLVRAI